MASGKANVVIRGILISGLILMFGLMTGCDWSASWDLRKAEKALKRADRANAQFWCEKEYAKAQNAFDEGVDLARGRKINEARDKALEAYEWAEEAEYQSLRKAQEMEEEKASLNSKKY